jgi:hypothetical protein
MKHMSVFLTINCPARTYPLTHGQFLGRRQLLTRVSIPVRREIHPSPLLSLPHLDQRLRPGHAPHRGLLSPMSMSAVTRPAWAILEGLVKCMKFDTAEQMGPQATENDQLHQ